MQRSTLYLLQEKFGDFRKPMLGRKRKIGKGLGLIIDEVDRRPPGRLPDIHGAGYPAREKPLHEAAGVSFTSPSLVHAAPNPGLIACEKLSPVTGETD